MNQQEWSFEKPEVLKNSVKNIYTAEYLFKNLPPNKYEAVLKARNEFGWSELSSIRSFRKELLPEGPQNGNSDIKYYKYPSIDHILII